AMPQGGSLKIEAENQLLAEGQADFQADTAPDRYVKISVSDTGTGIAPDVLQKLFDPFFTTKEVGKGTGLGLTTVTSIVKNHGGFVRVQSQVGNGSQFEVYFPAAEEAEQPSAPEAPKDLPEGNGELILVVDDE